MKNTGVSKVKKIKAFLKLTLKEQERIIEALYYLGKYRVMIAFVPFKDIERKMGRNNYESSNEADINDYRYAKYVKSAISIAAKYCPWQCKCLVRALTAQKMMENRGVPITLYLGVKKDESDSMVAHAWTRCGTYFITGGDGKADYAVVARFSFEKDKSIY